MKLSSCRELKREVLGRAYRALGEERGRRQYRIPRARQAPARDPRACAQEPTPVAAVGVAPWRGREYKLAVRVFKGQEQHTASILRGLKRHGEEIDLATGVQYRPRLTVRAGGSIGHYKITAGTLGGFVEDDERYYMLSNNHVLANGNLCFGGDPILQRARPTSPAPSRSSANWRGGTL